MTHEKQIQVGDIVAVNFNNAQLTLSKRAEVHAIPCATGDSWVFEDELTGQISYVSEGCTVTLLKKKV